MYEILFYGYFNLNYMYPYLCTRYKYAIKLQDSNIKKKIELAPFRLRFYFKMQNLVHFTQDLCMRGQELNVILAIPVQDTR